MKSIKNTILHTIQQEHITPLARWKFVVFHIALWIVVLLTIAIGSFGWALLYLIWYMPENVSLRWMNQMDLRLWIFFLIWVVWIIFSIIVASVVFRKNGNGYRLTYTTIIVFFIFMAFLGGSIIHMFRISHYSQLSFQHVPPYTKFRENLHKKIPHPEEGKLLIKINNIHDNEITWRSPEGKIWQVRLDCQDPHCHDLFSRLRKKRPIVFTGTLSGEVFYADGILAPPHQRKKPRIQP